MAMFRSNMTHQERSSKGDAYIIYEAVSNSNVWFVEHDTWQDQERSSKGNACDI